jgi:prepilin signal peptidase PulO-like enzyme (type II secretory pathway)
VLVVSGLFYVLYKISDEWIGFGDVKLGIVLGLLAGSAVQACLLLFIASLLGVLISLPMMAAGKATRKTPLPFGPLLLAGMIVTQLFGQQLIDWYSRLLGI